jgi:hypothetical protein
VQCGLDLFAADAFAQFNVAVEVDFETHGGFLGDVLN